MTFSRQLKEFFYSLSATDKYSDFDSRKSFNRVNKPSAQTSLLYSHQNNSSSVSLTSPLANQSTEGVHETRLAWRHIKKWLHKHSQDLNATLLSPCTESDLREFQKDLGITLPTCVAEFFTLTDGQSTFNENGSGGLIYGLRLMSINDIAALTESWRKVHQSLLEAQKLPELAAPIPSRASEISTLAEDEPTNLNTHRKTAKREFPDQFSVPPGSILPVYAHSMWIPLITDEVGNCIAIDLSVSENSHPEQVWGQVIIFGRDFDTKFKIADNFGDFLLIFANDLEKGNWELSSSSDGEDMMCGSDTELVYVDHETRKELPYLDVLKQRATDKWIQTLSEEEKSLEANTKLIELLTKKFALQIPEFTETATDTLINDNLRNIDVFNTPVDRNNADVSTDDF